MGFCTTVCILYANFCIFSVVSRYFFHYSKPEKYLSSPSSNLIAFATLRRHQLRKRLLNTTSFLELFVLPNCRSYCETTAKMHCPAFQISTPLSPRPVLRPSSVCSSFRNRIRLRCAPPKRRSTLRMIGPFFPDFTDSEMMKSEIVRQEMGNLERDYNELAKLGTRYEVRSYMKNTARQQLHALLTVLEW